MGMVTAPALISGSAFGWPPGTRGSWPPWGVNGSTWGRGGFEFGGGVRIRWDGSRSGSGIAVILMDQMGWAVLARSCTAQLVPIGNNAASEPLDQMGWAVLFVCFFLLLWFPQTFCLV